MSAHRAAAPSPRPATTAATGPGWPPPSGCGPTRSSTCPPASTPSPPTSPRSPAPHLGALGRYPDVEAAEATLAAGLDLPPDRLVLTAGGAQAIALVAAHLGAGRVDEPEFSLYRRHLARLDPDGPRWRSDPHNPSGVLAGPDETRGSGTRRSCHWRPARGRKDRPGWSLGSLTKAFACPGLRLGYALAPDAEAADALRRARPAWAVGSLSCAVLPDLLAEADPAMWTAAVAKGRAELVAVLRAHGWHPLPSDAAVGAGARRPPGCGTRCARQAVVVRDCASFGLPDHVRHRGARRRRARSPRRRPHRGGSAPRAPAAGREPTRRRPRALSHHGGRQRDLPARPRWTR